MTTFSVGPDPSPTSRIRARGRVAAAVVALTAAVTLLTPGAALADGGSVSITPASGPVGTAVTVTGDLDSDCREATVVTVEIGELDGQRPAPDGSVRSTVIGSADATDGHFRVSGTIPSTIGTHGTAAPGPHGIHVYCTSQMTAYPWHVATTSFTVTSDTDPGDPDDEVTLGASSVTAGGSVTFRASGFAADSEVTATLHRDPVPLGTFHADGAGTVAGTVTIPADVPAGAHTLVLTGEAADGAALVLRAALTVVATDPGTPTTTTPGTNRPVSPGPAAPAAAVATEAHYTG